VAGFGPLDGVGSADMVLRNINSGAFEVYDIIGGQLAGVAALGSVGLDWQVGGFAVDPPTSSQSIGAASDSGLGYVNSMNLGNAPTLDVLYGNGAGNIQLELANTPPTPPVPPIRGLDYGPFRDGESPDQKFPTHAELAQDATILAQVTREIRMYSMANGFADMIPLGEAAGLQVIPGAFLSGVNPSINPTEINSLVSAVNTYKTTHIRRPIAFPSRWSGPKRFRNST